MTFLLAPTKKKKKKKIKKSYICIDTDSFTVCPQNTFSLPDSGNCYFLIFQNACLIRQLLLLDLSKCLPDQATVTSWSFKMLARFRQPVTSWSFKMLAQIWLLLASGYRASAYVAPCRVQYVLNHDHAKFFFHECRTYYSYPFFIVHKTITWNLKIMALLNMVSYPFDFYLQC